jgi:pilus assembly protein CpaB
MNTRSIVMLVVAVVIGLGAMKLTQHLLSSNKGNKEEEAQELVVAARDIKEEESLKPDMVKVIRMVKSAVPPNTFTSFKDVADRWVKTALLEGDVLVEKKLGPKGTPPGMVANIPKGMRAIAIDVTEQSGVSGFVLPGHHVDVIRFEPTEKGELRGETILQNVLVLAAGQLFIRPEERSVPSRTVTLALSPGDADTLVAARAKGALSLTLRGLHDHDVVARPKLEPTVDLERERKWKLEEEKRRKVEMELQHLKDEMAKRLVEPPAPKFRNPRIATIYRGINNPQRIRTDLSGAMELDPTDSAPAVEAFDNRVPAGLRANPVVAAGNEKDP